MYVRTLEEGGPRDSSPMRCSMSWVNRAGLQLGTRWPSAIIERFLTAIRGLMSWARRPVRIDWWKLTRGVLNLSNNALGWWGNVHTHFSCKYKAFWPTCPTCRREYPKPPAEWTRRLAFPVLQSAGTWSSYRRWLWGSNLEYNTTTITKEILKSRKSL